MPEAWNNVAAEKCRVGLLGREAAGRRPQGRFDPTLAPGFDRDRGISYRIAVLDASQHAPKFLPCLLFRSAISACSLAPALAVLVPDQRFVSPVLPPIDAALTVTPHDCCDRPLLAGGNKLRLLASLISAAARGMLTYMASATARCAG